MENIEYLAVSYALVGILILGYVGVQHHRVNQLWSIFQDELDSRQESDSREQ